MKPRRTNPEQSRRNSGYALLMVLFLSAAMLLLAAVAVPSLLTQGKREKEEELIWRGGQYARAVRLYYRKNGRFPQSLENLTKEQVGVRFLRKAYKDPMNSEDGSWRLIYVGPGGQIIGSVKRRSALQSLGPQPGQQGPAKPVVPSDDSGGPKPAAGPAGPPASATPAAPGNPPAQEPQATSADNLEGKVFGGSIIGVGSKINKRSIRIFDGGTTYREWEFLWDPAKEAASGAGVPTPAATPGSTPATTPGASPPGPSNMIRRPLQ